MAQNQIRFGVGFNVDANSLKTLKSQLQEIQKLTVADLKLQGIDKSEDELNNLKKTISQVDSLLDSSFNKDLGTLNIAKFNQNLKNSGQTLGSLQTQFNSMGISGANAFRNLTAEILTTKSQVKETQVWLEKMGNTMANTIRWSISSSALNAFTGSIQGAYSYAKKLDESLNNIRIVTEKSADEMERFARTANKAAQGLGASTTSYTNAALIYYQQGLSDAEVQARTDVTLKVANVTGQSADVVSEQLTSVWNGYKVSSEEAEIYIDKLSAVAATTAADLEELSTGMSKVASAANAMGVDIDQLNAQLATIISVTRQAPENVGTALKTIYARMGDLQLGETDDGIALGDVSSQLEQVGIKILDTNGDLRDMGMVMEEVAAKWNTWNSAQQQAVAIAMAGKRQYNNLLALFENWNMYEDSLQTSVNSIGTLQKQQDIYMESTEAHLQRLKATSEGFYDSLFDADTVNGVTDALTGLVGFIEKVVDSLGGGLGVLTVFSSLLTRVFGKQLAGVFSNLYTNVNNFIDKNRQARAEVEFIGDLTGLKKDDQRLNNLIATRKSQLEYTHAMSTEEDNFGKEIIKSTAKIYTQQDALNESLQNIANFTNNIAEDSQKIEQFDVNNSSKFEKDLEKAKNNLSNLKQGFKDFKDNNDFLINPVKELEKSQKLLQDFRKNYVQKLQDTGWEKSVAQENYANYEGTFRDVYFEQEQLEYQKNAIQSGNASLQATLGVKPEDLDLINEKIIENQQILEAYSDEARQAFENIIIAQKNAVNTVNAIDFNSLLNENFLDESTIEEIDTLRQQFDSLSNSEKDLADKAAISEKIQKKLAEAFKNTDKKIEDYEKELNGASTEQKKLTNALNDSAVAATKFEKAMRIKSITKKIIDTTSAVGSLVGTMQSLVAIGDVWSNSEASFGEKLTQSITSIGISAPILMSQIKNLNEIFGLTKKINEAKEISNLLSGLGIQLSGKENKEDKLKAIGKVLLTKAEEDQNKEKLEGQTIDKAKLALGDKEEIQRVARILGIKAETVATKGLGAAIWSVVWPLLIVVGVLAVVAVSITAVMAKWKHYDNVLAEATKTTNNLAEAYNNVKAAYDSLKNDINNYRELSEGLDGIIEGTIEWKEALLDVNNQVIDLIQKYPELAAHVSKNQETGALEIDEAGLDMILDKQLEATYLAQRSLLAGQNAQIDAQSDVDAMTVSKQIGLSWWEPDEVYALTDALKEDAEAFKNTDTLAKALEGTALDHITSNKAQLQGLIDNTDKIQELAHKLDVANKQQETNNSLIADSILTQEGGKSYSNSDYKDAISNTFQSYIDEDSVAYKTAQTVINNLSDDELKRQYANTLGSGYKVEGDKIVNAKGEEVGEWNKEAAKTALTTERAMKNAQGEIPKVIEAIDILTNSYIADEKASEEEVLEIKKAIASFAGRAGKFANLDKLTKEQVDIIKNINFANINDYIAKNLDYDDKAMFEKVINNTVDKYNERTEKLFTELPYQVKNLLPDQNNNDFWGSFNFEETQNLLNILTNLQKQGYDVNTYTALLEGQDIATQSKIAELISQVTWENNQNAEEEFNKLLEDNNIELDPEIVDNFVTQIELMENTIGGFDIKKAQENWASISKIISGLKLGDTISEEDYKTLGEEAEGYFVQMHDGTWKLIKDAEEFYNTTKQSEVEKAEAAVDETIKAVDAAEARIQRLLNEIEGVQEKNLISANTAAMQGVYSLESVTQETRQALIDDFNALTHLNDSEKEEAIKLLNQNTLTSHELDRLWALRTPYYDQDAPEKNNFINQLFGNYNMYSEESQSLDNYLIAGSIDEQMALLKQQAQFIQSHQLIYEEAIKNNTEPAMWRDTVRRIFSNAATQEDAILVNKIFNSLDENKISEIELESKKQIEDAQKEKENAQANLASLATSSTQLKTWYDRGKISDKNYEDYFSSLAATDLSNLNMTVESFDNFTKNKYGNLDITSKEKALSYIKKETRELEIQNATIEQQEEILNNLQDAQNNIWGQELINNLSAQITQQDILNQKLETQIQDYYILKNAILASEAAAFGFTGFDLNTTTKADLLAFANNEDFQDRLAANPKEAEKWDNLLALFDTTSSEYKDLQNRFKEGLQTQISLELQKLDTIVQVHLDLGQAERDWRDFQDTMARIADDDYLNKYMTSKFNFETYNQGLIETTNALNSLLAKPTLTPEEQEKVKEYQQTIMNNLSEQISLLDEMEQTYLDAVSNISEVTQQQMDEIETVNGLYEHQLSLIELLGAAGLNYDKNMAYENIAANLEEQVKLAEEDLARLTDRRAELDKLLASNSLSEEESRIYEKELDLINESLGKAAETYYSTLESQIKNLAEWFNSQVQDSFDGLTKDLFGTDLEWASEEWDMINKRSDQYLDSVNRAYEIKKLENKYLDSIDNASSVTTQSKLNKLMNEELKSLREKDKLSKYEIERANLMYDITLKQIALEEQQQNKSKMRLRRDASGNYSYQFVSDADEIAKVEQELMDLNNELYNLDVDAYKDNLNEAVSTYEEYVEKVTKILNDNTLTKEEKEKRIKETTEIYQDIIDGYVSTSKNAYENIATDVSTIVKDQVFGEESKRIVNEFINDSEQAFGRFATAVDGAGGFGARISNVIETFTGENGLLATFQTKLDPIVSKLNEAMEKPEDTILGKAASYLQDIADKTDDIQNAVEAATAVGADLNNLGQILTNWQDIAAAAQDAAEAANKVYKSGTGSTVENIDDLKRFNNFENTLNDIYSKYNNNEDWITLSNKDVHDSQMKEENDMAAKEWAEIERIYAETWTAYNLAGDTKSAEALYQQFFKYLDLYANKRDNNIISKEKVIANEVDSLKQSIQSFAVVAGSLQGRDYAAYENGKNQLYQRWQALLNYADDNNLMNMVDFESLRSKIAELKTGGYTGTWGSSGKLAMLHEKELILNKQDTENILSAVDMVRRIASFNSSFLDALEIFANERFNSDMMRDTDNNVLEQHVQIEAHFPNVSDRNEIEEAFNDLINLATQRVNRNIR